MNIYKTINLINSKIYVGKESKYDPNYLGSGKLLRKAIEKYGVENFVKEILEEVDDEEELNLKEIFWIKELKSTDHNIGYNIALGGNGGDTITNNPNKDCIRKRMSNSAVGFSKNARDAAKESRNKFHPGYGSEIEDSVKISYQKAHSLKMKKLFEENGHWDTGKKRSHETCKKISESKSREKHQNFGKHLTKETRQKIGESCSKTKKERKIFPVFKETICPHCGKTGKGPVMKIWHFNRCSRILK